MFKVGKEISNYHYRISDTPFCDRSQRYDLPLGEVLFKAMRFRVLTFINLFFAFILALVLLIMTFGPNQKIIAIVMTPTGFVRQITYLSHPFFTSMRAYQQWLKDHAYTEK